MNSFIVSRSSLDGSISIPTSKSQTLRAILFAFLSNGTSSIHQYLHSPDTTAMINACRALGATIQITPETLIIKGCNGKFIVPKEPIDSGNSGIVLRFIGAIAALSHQEIVITGDHSICHNRHVEPLLEGLSQLGVSARSLKNNGYAPIAVQGPIKSGTATLSGEDSQPVSGLLIASSFADGPIELNIKNPGEKPWIELTLSWLDRLGISYERTDYTHYKVTGNSTIKGFEYTVPGDLSSLAFPLAAALVTRSSIIIDNVDLEDKQGDKELIAVLKKMGGNIAYNSNQHQLIVEGRSQILSGAYLDINNYIDAIAILAVLGCFAQGTTELRNAAIARKKECDRIHCLATELRKMGANIEELEDGLVIHHSKLKGAELSSHKDHRLAMALTVAAMGAEGESKILGVECITKTYPKFYEHFSSIGAKIRWMP